MDTHRIETCTGSEWHTTERRSAMVKIGGVPIYEKFTAVSSRRVDVGTKGRHGFWYIAEYLIPQGTELVFTANANGRDPIIKHITVGMKGST